MEQTAGKCFSLVDHRGVISTFKKYKVQYSIRNIFQQLYCDSSGAEIKIPVDK